jgi:hypothetical protein
MKTESTHQENIKLLYNHAFNKIVIGTEKNISASESNKAINAELTCTYKFLIHLQNNI